MQLMIDGLDGLETKGPIVITLLRQIPGDDRPDYWLALTSEPINWVSRNHQRSISHLAIAARWQGVPIVAGADNVPVYIAFVTDDTLLDDAFLSLNKCEYVAIGKASDSTNGRIPMPHSKI